MIVSTTSKKTFKLFVSLLCCFLTSVVNLRGQNLEQIGQVNPLNITGGVSVNQIGYAVSGIESRRDPYSFFASGNLTFDLYGWSIPFSFTYSNLQSSFQQPFNQYSMRPTYKWLTGYFGFTSMNFSSYTLGGHLFAGAGIEAAPGRFKIAAMYGRLMKATEPDTLATTPPVPAFRRMGWGIKAGYENGNDQLYLILFGARDDLNSISYVPENENILPEENLVISLIGSKGLFDRVVLRAEYAISALNRDIRSDPVTLTNYPFFNNTGGLFTPTISSSFYNAFNAAASYNGKGYTVGFKIERIDPGYRTLGAYFFNNDLVNYTINGSTAILGGRLNIAASGGLQRDNLDSEKISSLRRMVGSVNIGYAASDRLNLSAAYSNFTSFTNIRSQFIDINQATPYDNLDTLNYRQISQNATLNTHYRISTSQQRPQFLNLNLTFQDAADRQGGKEQSSSSQFYLGNASYSYSMVPQALTLTAVFNYNATKILSANTVTLGPTLALSKAFLQKQLRSRFSVSWNQTLNNGKTANRIVNFRAGAGYSIKKKHNLNLSLVLINRSNIGESGSSDFTEFTATLGYSYNFAILNTP